MVNRRGNRPGLESRPPLKGIADPSFLAPEIAPGIPMPKPLQEAAKVKIQEDLAPQKIKAVKYLVKMGCGCYNDDGAITQALVEALDDCTPDVREATIKALTEVAEDEVCTKCGTKKCCEEEILMKLAEIAYERDETGCYRETNEEIREAAIRALEACCSSEGPVLTEVPESQIPETPQVPEVAPETPAPPAPPAPPTAEAGSPRPTTAGQTAVTITDRFASTGQDAATMAFTSAVLGRPAVLEPAQTRPQPPVRSEPMQQVTVATAQPPVLPGRATVDRVDPAERLAYVTFDASAAVPEGVRAEVFHRFVLGRSSVGHYEVVQSSEGVAVLRPLGPSRIASVARGDEVRFLR
jgi:hypothetical protein